MMHPRPFSSLTRRRFLQGTALAGAAALGAPALVSCRSPSEKLNVVVIGCGGRGASNMHEVYCEKPLTHSLREARLITETARRAGVATQMGTQIHATSNYRRVVELVQSG